MIVDIIMPKMGESIMEGTILEWRKKVGDFIEKDELFLEIGTDKVDSEIPSAVSGTLVEVIAVENDVIDVGSDIGRIETDADDAKELKPAGKQTIVSPPKSVKGPIKEEQGLNLKKSNPKKKKFFTPVVLKIAQDNNISLLELELISGTGRGGRVTKKDILTDLNNLVKSPSILSLDDTRYPYLNIIDIYDETTIYLPVIKYCYYE